MAGQYDLPRADVADVVQTTWLRLVENLGELRQPEFVGAWLASTARRECLRALRRSARERPAEFTTDHARPGAEAPSAEHSALDSEGRRILLRALGQLGERCQALLRMLAASPPASYADVSQALAIPVGSIGPNRARCLDRLRRVLEEREAFTGPHED